MLTSITLMAIASIITVIYSIYILRNEEEDIRS